MKVPTEDATEISQLCAAYAVKMTQGDVQYILDNVLTDDGSYSAFGETYNRTILAAPRRRRPRADPRVRPSRPRF